MPGWKSVEEIDAYLLSVELRDEIIALAAARRFDRDFKLREQIRDSAASAPRNISEGFERFFHGEFAYFVAVAKGSLGETMTHLKDARTRGYLAIDEYPPLIGLAEKAKKSTTGLLKYLQATSAPGEEPRRRRRSNPAKDR